MCPPFLARLGSRFKYNEAMPRKICKHCEPVAGHPWHFSERAGSFLFPAKRIFLPAKRLLESKFPKLLPRIHRVILYNLFKALLAVRILKEVDISGGDETLPSRTLVVAREAARRGIPVKALKFLGKESTNFFSINIKNKKIFFEVLPTEDIAKISKIDFDDKDKFKQILKSDNLPRAKGECFHNAKEGIIYAKKLGFPLVVKPRLGSLSKHITCNIQNEADLKKAIHIAQIINPEFIVEKFIKGDVHRVTLVDHKMAGCCLREAPNVIGDGMHTITELIGIKNEHPWRGETHHKNFTLHKIIIDENTQFFLAKQGLTTESVLTEGKKVYLHSKIILKCGADIHDKTDEIHPDNIALFEKISRLCDTPLVGLDFICQDISRPYHRQECAVLEANSLPYIDMHHYPLTGQPRNVASLVMDYALGDNGDK